MADPSHSSLFEKAISVTPIDATTYSAYLDSQWCIGLVPHGGYTGSILYRAAAVHFIETLSHRFPSPPEPIAFQISYLRRTTIGPALLKVENIKIGARVSTIHVSLLQAPDGAAPSDKIDPESKLEVKAVAYVNLSPPETETGPGYEGPWKLDPAPVAGSLPDGAVDLAALGESQRDGPWVRLPALTPDLTGPKNLQTFGPRAVGPPTLETRMNRMVEQWSRFTPGEKPARWSNEAVMFLIDMFPVALDRLAAMESSRLIDQKALQGKARDALATATAASFWYPTVSMNIDFKTRIPRDGVDWLYSRVVTRMLRGSRADLEVVVLDQKGQLVATSTQIALVVDPSRNGKGRESNGKL